MEKTYLSIARKNCDNTVERMVRAGVPRSEITRATKETIHRAARALARKANRLQTPANHGVFGWQVDHIRPLALYIERGVFDVNVTNRPQNIQPITALKNQRKGRKLT